MSLSTFILSELYSGGVLYGRELARRFEGAGILSWERVAPSSVYRALERLRSRGFVARWREGGRQGLLGGGRAGERRNRKFYLITRKGRRYFESLLAGELAEPRTYRNPLNIAVHCVRALPREGAAALLDARRQHLAALEARADGLASEARKAGPARSYDRLAAERILMKARAELFFAGSLADLLRGVG